ncbi:MAG: response regulator transcription factor [Chloroflexota bacterium]
MGHTYMVEGSSAPRLPATNARAANLGLVGGIAPDPARAALIVDDFSLLAGALAERIALDGYTTTIAGCVAEASDLCAGGGYDLVLVDWSLPDGDGLDVARLVRLYNPGAYIVLMSGFAISARDRRLRGTVNAVLCKPWRPGELQALLECAAGPRATRPRGRGRSVVDQPSSLTADTA